MAGFAISRLIYGFISDVIGRKKPLIMGLFICFLGTLVCMFSSSIKELIVGRLLQGAGAGAGVVVSGAILRDLAGDEEIVRTFSYMTVANIIFMASAPFVGGYLQQLFGWQANFAFIAFYVLVALFIGIFILSETNKYKTRENLKISRIKFNLHNMFTNKEFVICVISIFLVYGSIVAWLTLGPILLQNTGKMSPVNLGWTSLMTGFFYAMGALLNSMLVDRYSINHMLTFGSYTIFFSGTLMLLLFWLFNIVSFWIIVIPITIFFFGSGMIFPSAFAGALTPFKKIAGIAGAIVGFIQSLGGFVASGIISILPDNTQLPLAVAFILCGIIISVLVHYVSNTTLPHIEIQVDNYPNRQ
jgi:Arabinose efflux permease